MCALSGLPKLRLFVIAVGDDYDEAFLDLLVPEGEGAAHHHETAG